LSTPQDDVKDEVSKHGRVLHIHVEKNQPGGLVYILFREQEAATKAATGLHGRWFAGRLIVVDYMPPSQYCTRFPEAQQRLLDG
jgi:RNA-binding protein 23/39